MNSLLDVLRASMRANGAMSVSDYMQLALQHPEFGYYRHGDPLGQGGDFITAPEISQMFGEMIGLWCADVWRQMGKPREFVLLELGPGRGTLMQDALRATSKLADFHQALKLHLLESSVTLREKQLERLGPYHPTYVESLMPEMPLPPREGLGEGAPGNNDVDILRNSPLPNPPRKGEGIPDLPVIVIANEFFDALPIRQFEKTFHGWCERWVTMAEDELVFTLSPPDAALLLLIPEAMRDAKPGTVFELSPTSINLMRDLAKHIAQNGGAALVVDYGYAEPDGAPTLQAVAGHKFADVLANPGEADLTALVDFGMLRRAALTQGAVAHGPVGQGDFLMTLGIKLRAEQLKLRATQEQNKAIDLALRRLTNPAEMGTLFKAMVVASPNLKELAGF